MKETIFPLFLLILALLIGCNSDSLGLSSAMEEAIAKQYATVSDFQLRQQVPWQEGGLALVTFDAVNNRDMVFEDCYGIGYFRSLSAAYYTVFAAASSCDKVMSDVVTEGEPAALETIPHGSLSLVQQDTAVAFGKVNYSEGAQVRVDWFDGQSDTVDIVDQFYLGPREGFSEVKEALLLDGDGSELASIEP
jgi:hypothetical protein